MYLLDVNEKAKGNTDKFAKASIFARSLVCGRKVIRTVITFHCACAYNNKENNDSRAQITASIT